MVCQREFSLDMVPKAAKTNHQYFRVDQKLVSVEFRRSSIFLGPFSLREKYRRCTSYKLNQNVEIRSKYRNIKKRMVSRNENGPMKTPLYEMHLQHSESIDSPS